MTFKHVSSTTIEPYKVAPYNKLALKTTTQLQTLKNYLNLVKILFCFYQNKKKYCRKLLSKKMCLAHGRCSTNELSIYLYTLAVVNTKQ